MALIYFDSNVCIGKHGPKHPKEIWKTEDILASMDRAGISGALVCHGIAKDGNPVCGNNLLAQELKKYPRLYGCYIIAPGHTGSFLSPDEMIAEAKDARYGKIRGADHLLNKKPKKKPSGSGQKGGKK